MGSCGDEQVIRTERAYCFFGFIQTRSGRLVATVTHLVRDPGRNVACSLTSDDDGKTWNRSNLIDLGGHGDHSGAMEPTLAELDPAVYESQMTLPIADVLDEHLTNPDLKDVLASYSYGTALPPAQ